jgi:hypothetical protein
LTGCRNGKNNNGTDQATNDKAQNEATGAADTDNGTQSDNAGINEDGDNGANSSTSGDTDINENDGNGGINSDNSADGGLIQLLQLNKAWALVRTVELDQPDFQVPAYKADVKPYKIAKDLSNIENISQFAGFTKEQVKMLVNNGFIVLPSNDTRTYYVYDDNEYKGVPNFITSDSILHLYHQFYDKSLMSIEANSMYQDLDVMTKQMLDKSILMLQKLTDEDLKALQQKNIVYFLVARMLLLANSEAGVTVDAKLLDLAKQEYDLIQAAGSMQLSPLFGVDMDYSQYTVRGHYTRTEELGRYFKTMMWFGNAPLEFVDKSKNINFDNVYQALLITYTTIADSESVCDAQLWSDIYQPTAQYVGLSDDVNVFTMNGLRSSVFGNDENPDIYNDEAYQDKLTEAVKALPEPQIQGKMARSSIPTGKQFRFMGQRYILDSDILQTLMKPIIRPVPTALDVMGVFGSTTAEELLFNVYRPQDDWPEYTDYYKELKSEVSGYDTDYWKTNLYSGWLWSIQETLKEYDADSGMPFFMTTKAWKYKSLNTALGSYTELKHDSVLYGKQPMAEMGGPVAMADKHYVEPDIELYSKLLYLTDFTCSVLEDKGMLNDSLKHGSESYKDYLKLLIECSVKELNNEPLTEEENKELLWSGGTMEDICLSFVNGVMDYNYNEDPTDMLVTDIATCDGSYLSEGTGYFDHIYVVFPYEGKLYLSRGSVYSFYEFLSSKRLTDEEWWGLQGIKVIRDDWGEYAEFGEPSADLPAQPDWISNFKSDKNDVIITSLEVLWGSLEE